VGYLYRVTDSFGFDDRQGLLLFPGLYGDLRYRRGALRASIAWRAYPVFGSMSAPSYSRWRLENPDGRTKTVLQREGYVYGVGMHTSGEARVGLASLELRGGLTAAHFESIEGLDRSQERVDHDQHVVERPFGYSVSIWASAPSAPLQFGATLDGSSRWSTMPGAERRLYGRRVLVSAALPL
jgi:hypothetical protein